MLGILETKLHRPAALPKPVPRPQLIQRLNDGLAAGRVLTLVSAPAGFGKSACVSQWLDGLEMPVAWLSLDPADDDPGRFFHYLIAALQRIEPSLAVEIAGVLRAGQIPPAEAISIALINDILRLKSRCLLALDDFQVLQDPLILQVMHKLVANLPAQLHLVLLTREDPALPLARLRASNQLSELRAADLRFTSREAACLLNDRMGLSLSEADIRALEERTEGWIAGLQLAALALQASPETSSGSARSSFIARLSGSHRFILSYLTEEVLSRQPSKTRRFLLQTSLLDRLSGDLCDAVTGRSDSRSLLESLYNANLFLVPLDDEGRWYRYHHLFADLLRDLQQAQHKDECSELHRRASRWYAQSEAGSERFVFTDEAVRHALAAGDSAQVLSLLESRVVEMLIQGYAKTVVGWLRAIPEGWTIQSPRANLAFAWMHLLRGDFTQAAPFVERLQAQFGAEQGGTGSGDAHPDPSLEAEWLALQAMLLNMQGRPAESLELGKAGLKLLPEGNGYVRSLIYMAQAGAYQSLDDYPNAKQSFEMLIQHARAGGNSVSELLGISALLQMTIMHGELHFAYELAAQTVERLERSGMLPPVSAAAYGALGHICHQWYQLEQVHSSFERAIQVSALGGYSDAEISYALIRSRLRQVEGDLQSAAEEFQKAAELARRIAPAWVREEIISQQVRLALAQDQLAEAEAALRDDGFVSQGGFEVPALADDQKVTPPLALLYNCALRILLYRAQSLQEEAALPEGLAVAERVLDGALRSGYLPVGLETLLLRAQMQAAGGDAIRSLADYAQALELAEPEGFISLFIEEGQPVATALALLLEQERLDTTQLSPGQERFARHILSAFPLSLSPEAAPRSQVGLLAALTARELDVLRLMAEGLKYEEIARKLVVSLNTVRSHVKAVYAKLGVNNRTQAIETAHQHQIL